MADLCLATRKENEITTVLFVQKDDDLNLSLSYAYSKETSLNLMLLLNMAWERVKSEYPNANIEIETVSPTSETILKKLFPKVPNVKNEYVAYWNYS